MQCLKISCTPLTSKFAVSFGATCLLILIYLSLTSPHFAYAAKVDSIAKEDHNHRRLPKNGLGVVMEGEEWVMDKWKAAHHGPGIQEQEQELGEHPEDSEPELELRDEQHRLVHRAPPGVAALDNNIPNNLNILPGDTNFYVFPNATVWKPRSPKNVGLPSQPKERQESDDGTTRTVYVTVNTCLQPSHNGDEEPPQLMMYVSTNADNVKPGPGVDGGSQLEIPLDEGFAEYNLQTTGDVYVSVSAPGVQEGSSGSWNYEIAASIDDPYHAVSRDTPFMFLVDSDSTSALLVTNNLTQANPEDPEFQKWMDMDKPFTVFANRLEDSRIKGLGNSFCGLRNNAKIAGSDIGLGDNVVDAVTDVEMGMITRGLGNKPKEQFHLKRLNASTPYLGWLAMNGNSTKSGAGVVGGGGKVWTPMNFTTKSDGNCQVLFNLPFCSEVAYAVPSNPLLFPPSDANASKALSSLYDDNAAALYKNFSYSLQQIPCNTTASAQYSLARTCTDCARDYKTWLCAVTIPRCEDYSAQKEWLQARNVGQAYYNGTASIPDEDLNNPFALSDPNSQVAMRQRTVSNSSRNPLIDEKIQPGPYNEVLPCEDLCYSLVQSCPAALGFACPLKGQGWEGTYHARTSGSMQGGDGLSDGSPTCSYLGAVYYLNNARRNFGGASTIGVWMGIGVLLMLLL